MIDEEVPAEESEEEIPVEENVEEIPEEIPKPHYTTPPGVMEQEVPLPPGYEHLAEQGMKAIKWHNHILIVGRDYVPGWLKEIEDRKSQNQSCIIAIVGPPGKGKSYFALKLAELFDEGFKLIDTPSPPPGEDSSQLVYAREHFLYLCGNETPLKRRACIILDEAQIAGGSRSWYDKDQRALMHQIESIRYRGYVVIVVVLHLDRLDKILRKFVLSYMVSMNQPGEGVIYSLFTPLFANEMHKKRIGVIQLGLPDEHLCAEEQPGCLECPKLHHEIFRCSTKRAIYERKKFEYLTMINEAEKKRIEADSARLAGVDIDAASEVLWENVGRMLRTQLNTPNRTRARIILQEAGLPEVNDGVLAKIIGKLTYAHPDWVEHAENAKPKEDGIDR